MTEEVELVEKIQTDIDPQASWQTRPYNWKAQDTERRNERVRVKAEEDASLRSE